MRRAAHKPMASINVVPYIDVMLVLLVIFMVTAPILSQGVLVDLPKETNQKINKKEKDPIVVSIDARGHLFLNVAERPDEVVSKAELQKRVGQVLAQAKGNRTVLVKADRQVRYDKVVSAMSLLQQAGAGTVGLVTETNQ